MDAWVVWILVAVVLAVGEILTVSFFLAPFAVGAVIAAVADAAGVDLAGSFAVFIVASLVTLLVVRPIARRHLRTPASIRTGTAALIGTPAMVVERIANGEGVGCAKINGEVWTARALDDDRVIEAGERVEVVEIRGATALVD